MTTPPLIPKDPKTITSISSIKDDRAHGKVGEWLKEVMAEGSRLSIVSAYFTVNAYQHLRQELEGIDGMCFLFGDPAFVQVKDGDKAEKNFRLTDEGSKMAGQVQQRAIAKACAEWLERKAEIRSLKQANFLHGMLYHVADPNRRMPS